MLNAPESAEGLRTDLASLLSPDRVSTHEADRLAYARDLWPRNQIVVRGGKIAPSPPGVVVWPVSAEDVRAIVDYARPRGLPLVPFGAGSGVCGGIQPDREAIVVDLKRMRRVRSVDGNRLEARVEAGIIGQNLENELEAGGFTLGHFPSSIYCSTLGGWIAGRSAGQCSGRYGKIEDMVLGLTCVDGRGRVLDATRDGENGALLPLVIGSEGVLAIVTEATLRLCPRPSARRFASYRFDAIERGLAAIRALYQAGLRPAVARLYDPLDSFLARHGHGGEPRRPKDTTTSGPGLGTRVLVRALRHTGALNRILDGLPAAALGGAMLVLIWEDEPLLADAERSVAGHLCAECGGTPMGEGPAEQWLSRRHAVSYRQSPIYAAGGFVDTMEVASTWSRLLPMYAHVREALAPDVFVMAHFSHAYPDGASIYFTFAGSAASNDECLRIYDRAWKRALDAVLDAGGTLSHHHGVGRSKAPAMSREHGVGLELVRALKEQLDPSGILNPGVLLPPREEVDEHA